MVISGPGGVGKGTIVRGLLAERPDLVLSVSATTRDRRNGEVDGVHYHFLSEREFDQLVAEDGFLEWAAFGGRRYGTPWSSVRRAMDAGRHVVLEIETQGAAQVRARFPEALLIFLAPPSFEALAERLRGRGTDDEARIAERLRLARDEIARADEFDHVVVNAEVDATVAEVARILAEDLGPGSA